jgi:hypothetical protein
MLNQVEFSHNKTDIDYFGYDISPSTFVYYATQDLCCAACQNNPVCQGIDFTVI